MEEAKDLHQDPKRMTEWIHRWLLPYFENLKLEGKIVKGKIEFKLNNRVTKYDGYIDKLGRSYGKGSSVSDNGS